MSIMVLLCACKSTEEDHKDTTMLESTSIKISEDTNYHKYDIYDSDTLNIESIDLFTNITENNIYNYAEQTKGAYTLVTEEGIIPTHLLSLLEESLYNSTNLSSNDFMEDIFKSSYFETLKNLGADEYQLDLEEVYQLFPEVYEHRSEIENIYQAYRFINNPANCIAIFHINEVDFNKDFYVFTYGSGGSDGVNSVLITEKKNEEFVELCKFETQNNGYGRVIKYQKTFYYVFLEYNNNLKNYDGIRIHKLGANAETENILIKYLPEEYIWKNVYEEQTESRENINSYVESIKETISSDEYIERGNIEVAQLFYGDEKIDTSFPLADEYNQYHKIDFTNTGIPIYIEKSIYIPSNYQTTWHQRAKFYTYDTQADVITELHKLEIGKQFPVKNELVQLWFKMIDNKVFTFAIHHLSDYNYMMNVMLIEDEKITIIRTDILLPKRTFNLREGNVFRAY